MQAFDGNHLFIAFILGPDTNSYSVVCQLIQDALPDSLFVHSSLALASVFDEMLALVVSQTDRSPIASRREGSLRHHGSSSSPANARSFVPVLALANSNAAAGFTLASHSTAAAGHREGVPNRKRAMQ